ncbi:MAG TPA: hypothetical protein VML55_20215 [Planctomycetaceae bacterium]|nr:hypothetical protein [Planctomycetaceae bacterium]
MAKAWTHRPATMPSRQCPNCAKWYHARSRQCPACGAANPLRSSPARVVKKRVKRRSIRRKSARRGAPGDGLAAAIQFVEAAGGIKQARQALETIERIRQLS